MLFDKPKLLQEELKNDRRFFVEKYNKTAYLYVTSPNFSKMYAIVWLANFARAPEELDEKSLNQGKPMRMSRANCTIPDGLKKDLQITFEWLNEDKLVVREGSGEIIAVLCDAFSSAPKAYCKYISGKTRYGCALSEMQE